MKKSIILSLLLLALWGGNANAHKRVDISFNFFYSNLSPYGDWIEIDFGTYAWRPGGVNYNWQPYSEGRWVWTRYGWYWDSYESFGWATYHYGRWYFDDYYGWIWLPDYEWAPAWVEWRYDDDYVGWSPLPPYASFFPSTGIHFSISWRSDYRHWHFVRYRDFCSPRVYNYYVVDNHKYRIFSRTKYRTNYDYRNGSIINHGIDRNFVEKRGGYKVREADINYTSKLRDHKSRNIGGDRVNLYKPSREELETTRNIKDYTVKRTERKSSLDISKIERRGREFSERDDRIEKRELDDDRYERSNYDNDERSNYQSKEFNRNENNSSRQSENKRNTENSVKKYDSRNYERDNIQNSYKRNESNETFKRNDKTNTRVDNKSNFEKRNESINKSNSRSYEKKNENIGNNNSNKKYEKNSGFEKRSNIEKKSNQNTTRNETRKNVESKRTDKRR